jgi:hypothetical protein
MDNGAMLPGVPTMPNLISRKRELNMGALRSADAEESAEQADLNLDAMQALLEAVLSEQLSTVVFLSGTGLTATTATAVLTVDRDAETD